MSPQSACRCSPASTVFAFASPHYVLQRKCACGQHSSSEQCHHCREHGRNGSQLVQNVLLTPGAPLPQETRQFFESRLPSPQSRPYASLQSKSRIVAPADASEREADRLSQEISPRRSAHGGVQDFSRVRVHSDAAAAQSAKAIHADAYAAGSHLVFAEGKYSPHTERGQRLLAHELVHVLQQRELGAANNRSPLLQRQSEGSGSGSDDDEKSDDDKPKDPNAPDNDSSGISIKREKGKWVYCVSVLGHDVCSDTLQKAKDYAEKMGKKKGPFIPDASKCPNGINPFTGVCCPKETAWNEQSKKCEPFRPDLGPAKCAPFERPNTLYPGCCKPGEDRPGCNSVPGPVIPHAPDAPVNPPPGTTTVTPAPTPSPIILHFQFDQPSAAAARNEQTLLKSLVPEDQGKWSSWLSDLAKNPGWKFQLVGRASPEGDKAYNHGLGERRALLVKSALDAKKLGANRLVDVKAECDFVENGVYNCGEKDATGPESRQVKVIFEQPPGAQP
jgi:Domain of unknown function (DUF4157)